MTKQEKVMLLKAIEKKTSFIENLLPMEVHFVEDSKGLTTINGKQATSEDVLQLDQRIGKRNQHRHQPHIIWKESKTYIT